MKDFFYTKLVQPILNLLRQGISPEKIALSICFGVFIGIFPLLGSTVILCTIATFVFRLNIVAIQIVNYLVYPLQLILFIPFIRIGETVLQKEHFPLSMEKIFYMIKTDILGAISELWWTNVYGMFAWLIISIPCFILLYFILTPILKQIPLDKLKGKVTNE
jgi:hypothetical protein